MIAGFALDVAPGSPSTMTFAMVGIFVLVILIEGGILTLFGMRPIGKAFVNSFLVNLASIGTGFVLFAIADQLDLRGWGMTLAVLLGVTTIQAIILGANRANLSRGRAWFAAFAMKSVSLGTVFLLMNLLNL